MEHPLLTPIEAAQTLGIGRSKLYELLAAGALESVQIGRSRRVPVDALRSYVLRLRPKDEHLPAPVPSGFTKRL